MVRTSVVEASLVALTCALLLPQVAWAQQASGIAGVVRDTSGAVLPGVTVDATSPALIEKVRTSVTDGEGRFNIVDLRPGTYVVTFSLAGFSTVRREGIELTSGFTATVNADLQVGGIEETITVTGESPLVDVQSVRQQEVISRAQLEALPTGTMTLNSILVVTPALSGAAAGVGSAQGTYRSMSVNASYHGKRRGGRITFDGMNITNQNSGDGAAGYVVSGAHVEEISLESGGATAEVPVAGYTVNYIPRSGSNTFSADLYGTYAHHRLQSSNLTDALRARGLTTESKLDSLYDFTPTFGGPIKRDRLWIFAAGRWTGTSNQWAGAFWNKTQGTRFYTPDLDRPANREDEMWTYAGRSTWQASPINKVNVFADVQHNIVRGSSNAISVAPEAIEGWDFTPQGLYQVSWSSPRTSRLLFEAGVSWAVSAWPQFPLGDARLEDISISEASTGFRYNAAANYVIPNDAHRYAQRASVAYVTGSHAFKVGMQLEQARNSRGSTVSRKRGFQGEMIEGNVAYTFLNGVPNAITQYASPFAELNQVKADLGIFAQDAWTISRLTLNYGLRFEYYNGHVPAQDVPANAFMPARSFAALHGVPSWKDLLPRLGAAYDLFGNGRTALKAAFGRYTSKMGVVVTRANNPITATVDTVNRTWNDVNGNYIPDCDLANRLANGECGQISNLAFGQTRATTRYDPEVLRGWHTREYVWDFAAEVQHELLAGTSIQAGYYRNWYGNFLRDPVIDNLAVTPEDFDPYCVTAPVDPRLPGGGGYQVCGVYDIKPEKFGVVDNLVRHASNYGKQLYVNDFFGVTFATRLGSGARFGGGVDTGRSVADRCFVVDSPQELLHCRVARPFAAQTQLKVHASYPLPGDIVVSGIFRNEAALRTVAGGETLSIEANYAARNDEIAPSLGRNLAACGTRAVCTATATVPLVAPYTMFEDRLNQLDLRLSKILRLGRARLQGNFDLYNALNAAPVISLVNTYGGRWQRPTQILEGRLIQVSAQLSF